MPTGPHVKNNAHLSRFHNESINYRLEAATDPDRTAVTVRGTKYQVFVKRIAVHVTTSAAQALTFKSGTTNTVLAVLPASAAAGAVHVLLDAEEEGHALPQGESLVVEGAAGVAGQIEVVAYQCVAPGAVLTPADL